MALSAQPVIGALQNNYSFLLPGTPNYGLAPGTIFIMYGSNMAPAGLLSQGFNPTLNKNLGGVSVKFTVGATTTEAIPYYVSPTQIAAILPSNTPLGAGTVRVTYNGLTSAPFAVTIVQGAFGIMTMSGNGIGQAAVMDLNYNLLGITNAANPDQYVIFWGSGQGPDPNDETQLIAAPQNLANLPFEMYIGGKLAPMVYHGRSTFPGLDQIIVRVPLGISGCYAAVYAKTGNYISNYTSIPVATNGKVCSDYYGTAADATLISSKTEVNAGFLQLGRFTSVTQPINVGGIVFPGSTSINDSAGANFQRSTPFNFTNYGGANQPSFGSCILNSYDATNPFFAPITKFLDAGSVTFGRQGAAPQVMSKDATTKGFSISGTSTIGAAPLFLTGGGTFTFTGLGGPDVGAFQASVTSVPPFSWTNMSSINNINRNASLDITWAGGGAGNYVYITGYSSTSTSLVTFFTCAAETSAGHFTIPRDILASMGPSANILGLGSVGQLYVYNYLPPVRFSAPGLDIGYINWYTEEGLQVTYQ
jgi:uncharacterized protein (TIGR03437 family)